MNSQYITECSLDSLKQIWYLLLACLPLKVGENTSVLTTFQKGICYIMFLIEMYILAYRNTWLGKKCYNFCYSANMLNISSHVFDRAQYCIA